MTVLVLLLSLAAPTSAQPPDLPTMLARVCWSEAGLRSRRTGECAALHRALWNKSQERGLDLETHMRAYASKVFSPARTDHRRWLAHLHADGRRPLGWGRLPWRNSRPGWIRLRQEAARILAENPNPCDGEPLDWGVREAVQRYLHRNRRAVVVYCGGPLCGGTVNVFLRASGG